MEVDVNHCTNIKLDADQIPNGISMTDDDGHHHRYIHENVMHELMMMHELMIKSIKGILDQHMVSMANKLSYVKSYNDIYYIYEMYLL